MPPKRTVFYFPVYQQKNAFETTKIDYSSMSKNDIIKTALSLYKTDTQHATNILVNWILTKKIILDNEGIYLKTLSLFTITDRSIFSHLIKYGTLKNCFPLQRELHKSLIALNSEYFFSLFKHYDFPVQIAFEKVVELGSFTNINKETSIETFCNMDARHETTDIMKNRWPASNMVVEAITIKYILKHYYNDEYCAYKTNNLDRTADIKKRFGDKDKSMDCVLVKKTEIENADPSAQPMLAGKEHFSLKRLKELSPHTNYIIMEHVPLEATR